MKSLLSLSTCENIYFQKTNLIKLGDYQIHQDKILGYGSFSKVYLGTNSNGNKVCVKSMSKSNKKKHILKMANQQAKILQVLSHPGVCSYITTLESENHYYIICDYIEGPTLSQYLKNRRQIPCCQAFTIAKQFLNTLKYLHEKKIMHRDLKPDNIMFNEKDNVVLIDFGFACRLSRGDETTLHQIVGTPSYMSPQLLQNKRYTSKSDIWSFGIIMYQMVYGKVPWIAKNDKHLIKKIKTEKIKYQIIKQYPITHSYKHIINKCLQIDPQKRISWNQLFYLFDNINNTNFIFDYDQLQSIDNGLCGCKLFGL